MAFVQSVRFRQAQGRLMGSVHFSVPEELILFLKRKFELEDFVETGTFQGASAVWASQHFKRVFTIEANEPLWRAARARHGGLANIQFILGNSPEELTKLLPNLGRPLFWLDAHWCGPHTAGETNECPLLAELTAIAAADITPIVILIDDARYFLAPPPSGHNHDWQQWPDLAAVVSALRGLGNPYIVVEDDVIAAVPAAVRGELVSFLRRPERAAPAATAPAAPQPAPPNHLQRRVALMKRSGINMVLDVGANAGQFGKSLRSLGFRGRIISFEPLTDAFAALQRTTANDALWTCHNIGLSDVDQIAVINVSANSFSSSFLPVSARSVRIEPSIAYVGRQEAQLRRLDGIIDQIIRPGEIVYLKIDTQGYELNVLKGALNAIKRAPLIQLETAFSRGYEGQPLIEDVIGYMRELGYRIVAIEPGWEDFTTAEMLEADLIFARD
jgi:FkbM family methyltransferase